MIMVGADIGIDLGTANILVYIKGRGIVLHEPSVVAVDKSSDTILAVGEEARRMLGRTPGNIVAVRPLREGVISDYYITEKMLKYFIQKAVGKKALFLKPRIAVCVPSAVTEVERRAVQDAARQAGARQVFVIEEPIAAAIGAGINIGQAMGSMIIDIGGGTTDVAIISLGGMVVSTSIKVAGDNFDEAIVRYMRRTHNMLIGERTAEEVKISVGSAYPRGASLSMDVRGRNLVSGLPRTVTVTSEEMIEALHESVTAVVDAVINVLERTPPELASDIGDRGIVMTGGGSLLNGLDMLISKKTGIDVYIAEEPLNCVAIGTGMYIEYITTGRGGDMSEKRTGGGNRRGRGSRSMEMELDEE
ncbi:MAG: rod shape-determining protein MreB [Defluviitaleaceae bacterium]|nr:rod shape-determining protein MreB [Defluviitaleaceae bacterium]